MDPEDLIEKLEEAFSDVERPETSLRQFQLTDEFGMSRPIADSEWKEAGRNRIDTVWTEVPDSEIEECGCVLAHMGPKEFLYYLPAYIRYSLRHYRRPIWETDIIGATVFSVYPSKKNEATYRYTMNQLSLLNQTQKELIIEFLEFVSRYAEDVQKPGAKVALERYWLTKDALNK